MLEYRLQEKKKRIIQVQVFEDEAYFVATCTDLGVFVQGKTLNELAYNIREAVSLATETENLSEMGYVENPLILANIELGFVNPRSGP